MKKKKVTKKKVTKKKVTKKKVTKKKVTKKKEKRYSIFYLHYTAVRSYDYNRPAELESFVREIPVLYPLTKKGFQRKWSNYFFEHERNIFEKIASDTEDKVIWSQWNMQVKVNDN